MSNFNQDFQVVSGKGKKIRFKNRKVIANSIEIDDITNSEIAQLEESVLQRLDIIRSDIKATDYFCRAVENVATALELTKHQQFEKLVCFGLGAFSRCPSALHQLAFILEIRNYFNIEFSEFYDPIWIKCEKNILTKLKCNLIEQNCEGKYSVEFITLFYFPHCPKQLTNNFLWKNWESERLKKTILICNSFEALIRNTPERFLIKDAEYILRIYESSTELQIENNYRFSDIFNDISIHLFLNDKLRDLNNEFWLKKSEPMYCDTELITNQLQQQLTID